MSSLLTEKRRMKEGKKMNKKEEVLR